MTTIGRRIGRRKETQGKGNATFLLLVVLLIVIGVLNKKNNQAFDVETQKPDTGATTVTTTESMNKYQAVNCSLQLETLHKNDTNTDDDKPRSSVQDPNQGMIESPKKFIQGRDLTSTTELIPSFWIALHKQGYDWARWNSIMLKGRYYETQITQQFIDILSRQTKDEAKKEFVVDIGMNIGWFTILSRAMGYNVVGFDPNPIMHTRVCESLQLNHFDNNDAEQTFPNVQIFPYGLGPEEKELQFTLGKNPGGSSFHEHRVNRRFRRYMTVPVTTLDGIALDQGWLIKSEQKDATPLSTATIRLLKVDVEGYESQVWKGGKQLLQSGAIQNILMEKSGSNATDFSHWDLMYQDPILSMLIDIYRHGFVIKSLTAGNGVDPHHQEMVPDLNQALGKAVDPSKDSSLSQAEGKLYSFMARETFNILFVPKPSTKSR